jgi:23S rRNA (uracil1939-C5)-methyltransferase
VSVHEPIPRGCEPACHGCRHRELTSAASVAQKTAYLQRALAPWADRLQPVRVAPPERRYGYRDRVTLTAGWDAAEGWRFGLVRRDELIAIHDCPVHAPRIRRLVHHLRATLPPHERLPLAYLHVAGAQATLVVKAREFDPAAVARACDGLGGLGYEGLWVHCHPAAGRKLFARSGWHLAWGRAESAVDGLTHGPTSFQQLLPELHDAALDAACAHLAPGPGAGVLDLYCGHGSSLGRWRAAGAATLGVELGGEAVALAARNAPGAAVLRGTCVARLPQVRAWWTDQSGDRLAYVNPPRSGLEDELRDALARELQPERTAYLSCSAGTLARDLAAFEAAGHDVRSLLPFDFFPGTHHVECLALLSRRG